MARKYLRVTRATDGPHGNDLLRGKLGWAYTDEDEDDGVTWISPYLDECPYLSEQAGDEWTVVDENRVPGRAWAALAKRKLLGEDVEPND